MREWTTVSDEELKVREFEMLKYFRAVCEENDIPYSLAYGTLLGARRHGGFIPWDDDVDVFVLREDYERLISALRKNHEHRFQVMTHEDHPDYYYNIAKLVDTETALVEHGYRPIAGYGVFVDIFPLDRVPSDDKAFARQSRKAKIYSWFRAVSIIENSSTAHRNLLKRIASFCLKIVSDLFGTEFWLRAADRALRMYEHSDYDLVCCLTEYPKPRERMSCTRLLQGETILFEGEPFSCVSDVEGYLTDRYGDYRKLPPENERGIRHNFTAYHRPEKPNVLHFAHLDDNRFSGVNAAVKQTLKAQNQRVNVAWCNVNKGNKTQVEGVQQFPFDNSFDIEKLPEPFCRPDLVVFQETHRAPYVKIAKQLRKMGIPYVTVPHGELSVAALKQKRLKKWLADKTYFHSFIGRAAGIQCLSEFERSQIPFSAHKFVATNGIELPQKGKTNFRKKGVRFVFVGRIDVSVKGLDLLVDAVALSAETLRNNGATITLCGPQYHGVQELSEQIRARGVEDLISLHDPVLDEEKAQALLDADLFIQTSRHEGMPMGVLEALGYGLPCVLTHGTTLAETVESVAAGFAAETSAESIAKALKAAVRAAEEEKLSAYSQNARTFAEENFSWEAVTEKTLKIYKRLGEGCLDRT